MSITLEDLKAHCERTIEPNGKIVFDMTSKVYQEHAMVLALINEHEKNRWIPVTERLPQNEETVLITVEHRPIGGKPYRRVIKAFYEDGNMNTEDSGCCWDTSEGDWEYDEESDGYIIPEGWWEDTDYCEVLGIVGDFVLAWMPLPKPFKEGEEE